MIIDSFFVGKREKYQNMKIMMVVKFSVGLII